MSIHLNENSIGLNWEIIHSACFDFGIDFTDEDIWEVAKGSDEVPNFENIYQYLVLSQLEYELNERFPDLEIDYFINGLDTHLYIDGKKVNDLEKYRN